MWTMIVACALLSLTVLGVATSVRAAEFRISHDPLCAIELEGLIEYGDTEKFTALLARPEAESDGVWLGGAFSMCLNSQGGSYDEAMKLIDVLWSAGVTRSTRIRAGDKCFSACALLFMAGYGQEGDAGPWPDRAIHVRGALGFHAPYISNEAGRIPETKDQIAKSYRAGVIAVRKLLKVDRENLFPKSLVTEILSRGPDEKLEIDTVGQAGGWQIGLFGYKLSKTMTRDQQARLCVNADAWQGDGWLYGGVRLGQLPKFAGMHKNRYGEKQTYFEGVGQEAAEYCQISSFSLQDYSTVVVAIVGEIGETRKGKSYGPWASFPLGTKIVDLPH